MLAYFLKPPFLEVGSLSISTSWLLLLLALSTVWHEIGHIQAARTFGLNRISIGAGIYYFIPVLFTDMTATYLLDKPKRLIIGMAGIYFEWIYVLVLLSCSLFFEEQLLIHTGFVVFLKSLYNLNPFFKTDGYWLLSDYLNVHQLRDRSYQTLLKVVLLKKSLGKTEVVLAVYALLHLSFYALFILFLIRRLHVHFGDLIGIEIAEFTWSTLKVGGVVALEILLIFHLIRLFLQAFYSLPKYLATVTKN
jgi:putative peptide zinc metalloprotease protein